MVMLNPIFRKGQIRCRFEDGTENLRKLESCMRSFQTECFSPYFTVVEIAPDQGPMTVVDITQATLQAMMDLAKFSVSEPHVLISRSTAITVIGLVLRPEAVSVPISGFPRQLGNEDNSNCMFSHFPSLKATFNLLTYIRRPSKVQ